VRRTVLLYGLLGGVLVAVLELVQWRFLVVEHTLAIYGGLVAAIFAALGIWLGRGLVRVREVEVETVREVLVEREVERVVERPAVPAASAEPRPFEVDRARLEALGITPREHEILTLIAAGLSNREIAGRLCVSENTVKTHSSRLFVKLDARRRTQAVQLAKAAGLLA
jgi:ATP/maltotriose-dependent transcriptional regulator MalT